MNRKSKIQIVVPMLAGMFLILPTEAAGSNASTHVASACTVDDISAAKYESYAAQFRFKGANTGEIVTKCNVVQPMDNGSNPHWNYLEVVYWDPDFGVDSPSQVLVTLWKVHNSNGGISQVGVFDSNKHPISNDGSARIDGADFGEHPFDFTKYAYYIEIKSKARQLGSQPCRCAGSIDCRSDLTPLQLARLQERQPYN